MTITIDNLDIFGRSLSILPEAPPPDPATDQLVDDLLGSLAIAVGLSRLRPTPDFDARCARLSAVLAAARAIVANRERSTPQAIVALLVPNLADALADALAAADAAR